MEELYVVFSHQSCIFHTNIFSWWLSTRGSSSLPDRSVSSLCCKRCRKNLRFGFCIDVCFHHSGKVNLSHSFTRICQTFTLKYRIQVSAQAWLAVLVTMQIHSYSWAWFSTYAQKVHARNCLSSFFVTCAWFVHAKGSKAGTSFHRGSSEQRRQGDPLTMHPHVSGPKLPTCQINWAFIVLCSNPTWELDSFDRCPLARWRDVIVIYQHWTKWNSFRTEPS